MAAMKPLFDYIFALEGFEMVAFWLGLVILYLIFGFVIDMLMQRMGFGPYINGALAIVGVLVGLYLRYNYFYLPPWVNWEPMLTMGLCAGSAAILLVGLSFVLHRYG